MNQYTLLYTNICFYDIFFFIIITRLCAGTDNDRPFKHMRKILEHSASGETVCMKLSLTLTVIKENTHIDDWTRTGPRCQPHCLVCGLYAFSGSY